MNHDHSRSRIDELFDGLPDIDPDELAQASTALDIARIIYLARDHRGLTQVEAAERSGLKQQAISRMEGGVLNVTIGTLERFLRKLEFAVEVRLVDDRSGQVVEHIVLNDNRERATAREAARSVSSNGSAMVRH